MLAVLHSKITQKRYHAKAKSKFKRFFVPDNNLPVTYKPFLILLEYCRQGLLWLRLCRQAIF